MKPLAFLFLFPLAGFCLVGCRGWIDRELLAALAGLYVGAAIYGWGLYGGMLTDWLFRKFAWL